MIKKIIKNRKNQNIVLIVEEAENQNGLAFVMHGLGGFKEQQHIQTIADAFRENDCTVIRFDATNSLGESAGNYEDATTTNYYEDLEDVIEWSKEQRWFQELFFLAGHSLGGLCVALYAQNHPEKIRGLAPISTAISGKLSLEGRSKEELEEKESRGYWEIEESKSKPGVLKILPWSHIIDRQKYDLLEKVDRLTMPVLLIVGENDKSTPPKHQKILYNSLPGEKELHIIKNAPHTFREEAYLSELKSIISDWARNSLK